MKNLKTKWFQLLRDERGQSTTEYILILAVVVMIAMKFKEKVGDKILNATETVGGKIDKALEDDL